MDGFIGAIEQTYGTGRLDHLSGLARRDPWVMAILALGMFSLVGLPPTSGLWGKVGLLRASAAQIDAGQAVLGWAALCAVVLGVGGCATGATCPPRRPSATIRASHSPWRPLKTATSPPSPSRMTDER